MTGEPSPVRMAAASNQECGAVPPTGIDGKAQSRSPEPLSGLNQVQDHRGAADEHRELQEEFMKLQQEL